jgi:histidinol-phosphate phosphatase family protein
MYRALFLDRDRVVNRERSDYVKCWDEFELLPGVLPALSRLSELGCPIIVVTNQSAIGRGLVSFETENDIHARLRNRVEETGGA